MHLHACLFQHKAEAVIKIILEEWDQRQPRRRGIYPKKGTQKLEIDWKEAKIMNVCIPGTTTLPNSQSCNLTSQENGGWKGTQTAMQIACLVTGKKEPLWWIEKANLNHSQTSF